MIRSLARINLLAEPTLRHCVVILRAFWLIRVRGRLRTRDSADAVKANVSHNMRSIFGANRRMNLLLFPLSTIETLDEGSRIRIIGPRNEFDLFTLAALGFDIDRMTGLDLITYSPHIELGDMHSMRFADGVFDAVICGWTLSHSTNPRRAADEILRVTRPGGIVAVGVEYSNLDAESEKALLGCQLRDIRHAPARVNSTASIRALFGARVGHVYFEHDAPLKRSHSAQHLDPKVSNVALVFGKSAA